ncbi:hypothetical protein NP493_115g00015 [Ridgeia piscesae]|uniref:Uncharacterized protein n=1 Tax=Ridgeia piscesae TaxID=27915 RepID=A0AAD9UGW5_RIDPI|nr:hypothetical protein NP493_115g00015 [Ridgeia piscesae]
MVSVWVSSHKLCTHFSYPAKDQYKFNQISYSWKADFHYVIYMARLLNVSRSLALRLGPSLADCFLHLIVAVLVHVL